MADIQTESVTSTGLIPRSELTPDRPAVTSLVRIGDFAGLNETLTAGTHQFQQTERSRTLGELQQHPLFGRLWRAPAPEAASPLEAARDQRLAMLVKKFEGAELTREDQARVAILTQRLRRLAPRVTAKSWTIAEESLSALEGVSARIDEIGAKYGL